MEETPRAVKRSSTPAWPQLFQAPGVATPRIVTTIFSVLHLTAAVPVLVASFWLTEVEHRWVLLIRATSILAIAFGIAFPFSHRWLPRPSYHVFVATSTVMITTVALAAADDRIGLVYALIYFYVVIDSAFFFSIAGGLVHLACALAAAAWTFAVLDIPAVGVVMIEVLLTTTYGVVAWLSRTAESAEIDPLTSLANRRALSRQLEAAVERASRDGGPLSIVLIDIDHFKDVNDSRGHSAGDELLVECARAWRRIVPDSRMLARPGGDEFALLLPGYTVGKAASIADQLREAVPARVTASAGVATWVAGDTASVLMSRTDVALYEAKTNGRDQTQVYGDRSRLTHELEDAVTNGELVMHFQDVVHTPSGGLVGREALIRWNHPARGVVPPDEFIPQAERTGAIHLLGMWALDQVCRIAGERGQDTALNASVTELRNPGYVDRVREALDRHQCDPRNLVVEITEAAYDERDDQVLLTVQQLRGLGVKIAIDDFGDGYASLRWLAKFPVDIIKIDGGFIRRLTDDDKIVQVVAAIVVLGRTLGVYVVAEQVETEEQFRILESIGCELMQGYYFGRPVPQPSADRHHHRVG